MKPGDMVRVKAFDNRELVRVVVQVIDNTVVICTREEWKMAISEMRNPDGVGFPIRDILEVSAHKSA